jgi:hypothetical protein
MALKKEQKKAAKKAAKKKGFKRGISVCCSGTHLILRACPQF